MDTPSVLTSGSNKHGRQQFANFQVFNFSTRGMHWTLVGKPPRPSRTKYPCFSEMWRADYSGETRLDATKSGSSWGEIADYCRDLVGRVGGLSRGLVTVHLH